MGVCLYTFVINNDDNQIIATVNGTTICNVYEDGDPPLNLRYDFTNFLVDAPAQNFVIVQGWNGPTSMTPESPFGYKVQVNPYHFYYHIEQLNTQTGAVTIIAGNNISGPGPNTAGPSYLVGTWRHLIIKQ